MSTTTILHAPIVRQISELELSERIIRNHIKNLDGCDALRFAVTEAEITYNPYVLNESGDYEQGDYCPRLFDVDDMNEEEVEVSTLLAALWEFAHESFSDGMIAVDPDSGNTILYR